MRHTIPYVLLLLVNVTSCYQAPDGVDGTEAVTSVDVAEQVDACELVGTERLNDTLHLGTRQWRGLLLDEARAVADSLRLRVLTREEARAVHGATIVADSGERYLCRDTTGVWYTFRWGSGSVTQAGRKVGYTLRLGH